jgi:hypothetical protein
MTAAELPLILDAYGPYLFPVLFVLGWVGVCHLIASLSGWKELASIYPATTGFVGTRYRFQSARMRAGMNYNNSLTVGTDVYALYISVLSLLRIGHSPLCIPWSEIFASHKKGFFGKTATLEFRRCPSVHIIIGERLSRKLVEGSARQFRVEEGSDDSQVPF